VARATCSNPRQFVGPLICPIYADAPSISRTLLPFLKHCKSYCVTSKHLFITHCLNKMNHLEARVNTPASLTTAAGGVILAFAPADNTMKQSAIPANSVRFGVYEFDLRSGELRKHGIASKLQEQPCPDPRHPSGTPRGNGRSRRTAAPPLAQRHLRSTLITASTRQSCGSVKR